MNRWIVIFSYGLLLLLVGCLALLPPTRRCSPKGIRPWAEERYRRTFDPALREPLADLRSTPAPPLNVTRTASELKISYEHPEFDSSRSRSEIFSADSSGVVVLPDGNRLRLAAVAVLLPSDVKWGDRRYASTQPRWIDPATGQPITPGPGTEWAGEEQAFRRSGPSLLLRVKKEGTAPLRWHWSDVFDARTHVNLHRMSGHSPQGGDGVFVVDLTIWHQTPLRVGVNFAFGPPDQQVLPLVKGGRVQFGRDASVEVLEILPDGASASEWGGEPGSGALNVSYATFRGFPARESDPRKRGYVLQIWPPENHYLVEAQPGGFLFEHCPGIATLSSENHGKIGTEEMPLRRYPRLGRAVFDLAKIPRLPEVRNLYKTPMPLIWLEPGRPALQQACDALELRNELYEIRRADTTHAVEDTNPGELLLEVEKLSGKRIYFNQANFMLTTQPPKGWWDTIQDWWRTHRP